MGFGAPRSKLYKKTLPFPCNVTKQNCILIMIMCKGKLQTYLGMCDYVTICVRKYVFRLDTVCCLVGDFIFALVGTSHFYPNLVSLLKIFHRLIQLSFYNNLNIKLFWPKNTLTIIFLNELIDIFYKFMKFIKFNVINNNIGWKFAHISVLCSKV